MIKVFDFRCTNGHIFEEFVDGTSQPVGADVVLTLQKLFQQLNIYSTGHPVIFPEGT